MFIFTIKIRWWRVVSFLLLATILAAGIYYITRKEPTQILPVQPSEEQEGQVWQV